MIRLSDVHVRLGPAHVLRAVSLVAEEGEIVAVVGPGGAGKSVLLKVVAGLVRPTRGEVSVGGREIGGMDELALAEVRRDIGMLFQNNALFDYLSVGENVAFPLRRMFTLDEEELRSRVAERLGKMSLGGFEERAVTGLSGGQKKRVGVARATVSRPPILLYDEPTAGLDPVTSQKIYDLIRDEHRARRTTNLIISSDLRGVLSIATSVVMLHEGRVLFRGSVDEAQACETPAVRQFIHGLTEGPL